MIDGLRLTMTGEEIRVEHPVGSAGQQLRFVLSLLYPR